MTNVGFIPVRGGSKSIHLKNIKIICEKPLIYWVLKAALNCERIDKIYVSTDSDDIRRIVKEFDFSNVNVISRSAATATDSASTESAMIEFAENYSFDNIALIQATSPLLTSSDLENGFKLFEKNGIDSVLSVVKQKRFIWDVKESGLAYPRNYDFLKRPRRQDFEGYYYVENGAFYIISKQNLIASGNRLFGNVGAVEMCEESLYEIDEPSDWIIVEGLLRKREEKSNVNITERLRQIKIFLIDSDGCLTDGGMYYSEAGDEMKKFNAKDGYGIRELREKGIIVGIITGENCQLIKRRAEKLEVDELHLDIRNKLETINSICNKYNMELKNVAYIGDDLNDLDAVKNVGFGCAVADAQKEVRENAIYVTDRKGGDGAVREVVDILLNAIT